MLYVLVALAATDPIAKPFDGDDDRRVITVHPTAGTTPVVRYAVALPIQPFVVSHVGATPGAALYVPGLARLV